MNKYRVYVRGYFHCNAETDTDAMNIINDNVPKNGFCFVVDKFTCNDVEILLFERSANKENSLK